MAERNTSKMEYGCHCLLIINTESRDIKAFNFLSIMLS